MSTFSKKLSGADPVALLSQINTFDQSQIFNGVNNTAPNQTVAGPHSLLTAALADQRLGRRDSPYQLDIVAWANFNPGFTGQGHFYYQENAGPPSVEAHLNKLIAAPFTTAASINSEAMLTDYHLGSPLTARYTVLLSLNSVAGIWFSISLKGETLLQDGEDVRVYYESGVDTNFQLFCDDTKVDMGVAPAADTAYLIEIERSSNLNTSHRARINGGPWISNTTAAGYNNYKIGNWIKTKTNVAKSMRIAYYRIQASYL